MRFLSLEASRHLFQLMIILPLFATGVCCAEEYSYQEVAQKLEEGKEPPQVQEGDKIGLASLKLREKLEKVGGIPIPKQFDSVIDAINSKALSDVRIEKNVLPSSVADKSFLISGRKQFSLFNQLRGDLSLRIISAKQGGRWNYSVELQLPKGWKLQDMVPKMSKSPIGKAPLPDGRFIFSTFDYTDEDGYEISAGVTIAANLDLQDVAPHLYKAINKIRPKNSGFAKSVVFEGFDKIRLNTTIKKDILQSTFDLAVPLRIGVDFEQLHKEGVLKKKPSGIRRIETGNIVATFNPTQQEASYEQSIRIYPTTQQDPLKLRGQIEAKADLLTMKASMDGEWDPAITKWLAIKNPAFEFNMDFSLIGQLISMGIPVPFTGIKVRGGMGFGPKDARTNVELAAGLEISDDPRNLDFALVGEMDKVSLRQFADLFSRVSKKNIPLNKLPELRLEDIKLYVVPKDMKIADRSYEAGFALGGALQISKFKGGMNVQIDAEDRKISAEGYVEPFSIKNALRITGRGKDGKLGTKDDRAQLKFVFPPQKDMKGIFEMDGIIGIPALKIEQEATLNVDSDVISFTTQGKLAGLKGKVGGDINIKQPIESRFTMQVNNNLVKEKLSSVLQRRKERYKQELNQARKNIKKAEEKYKGKVEKEKKKIERQLMGKQKAFQKQQKICKSKPKIKRLFTKACYKVAALKTEMLAKKKIYKNFMLKHGKKVGKGVLDKVAGKFVDQAKKLEKIVDVADKALQFAAKIKSISGDFVLKNLKQGKMPELQIELSSGKTINVEFDPKLLMKKIADSILKKARA